MIIPRFETIRVYGGEPLLLHLHLDRLNAGAAGREACEAAVRSACTPGIDAVLRLTWPALEVDLRPIPDDLEGRLRGVHCVTAPADLRRPTPGVKTTDVAASRSARAFAEAHAPAPAEALLARDDGSYTEGAFTNLLWRVGDVLHAPADDALPGVARRRLIEVAATVGLALARASRATVNVLRSADAVYLSSAVVEIVPVVSLDSVELSLDAGEAERLERWRAAYRSIDCR